jgi:hypothetical protein
MNLRSAYAIALVLVLGTPVLLHAQQAPTPAPVNHCGVDGCRDGTPVLYTVSAQDQTTLQNATGNDPLAAPTASTPQETLSTLSPLSAPAAGALELPQGGVVWATEDPTLAEPVLNVQAGSMVPFEEGRITRAVRFHSYSNYTAFIDKLEVTVYRASDTDLVTPLATIDMPVTPLGDATWEGELPARLNLREGDELLYIARAYGDGGAFDETRSQRIRLVTPADYARGSELASTATLRQDGQVLNGDAALDLAITDAIYGVNGLRLQNISIRGSRVRIQGTDIPRGTRMSINGLSFPVLQDGQFAAEFLEPVGEHRYQVQAAAPGSAPVQETVDVNVSGSYAYAVAIADVTLSRNSAGGNTDPIANDGQKDDGFLSEGRLAFYAKGKWRGKYLITAHADTRENQLDHLFDGFFEADAQDVFWRLDPDLYYPTYGDDSITYRDIDTQGKLYLRADWDQSQAVWGNFATGFTDTEYGQYNRSLYGAAVDWRSRATTPLGEARSQVKAFGSEAQSALGHSEFLGTGGSLYYLRHTDILPGSDQVTMEVRDPTTGLTEARVTLQNGVDYEIDNLQGRIFLTRPLAQITRENVRSLTRDTPLDGYAQILLVDYEYVPDDFSTSDISMGVRGKQWLGDHLAVGGTYVDENRGGDDYTLKGADVTLQAGRGTYLKAEITRSEATAAPIFYSDNGGLSFVQRNPDDGARSGEAWSVEGRANFKELGWTEREWTVGAWWHEVDAGFSVSRYDIGLPVQEYGAEFLGYVTDDFSLYGRYTRAEQGDQSLAQTQLTADWRLGDKARVGGELRQIQERGTLTPSDATLAALSYHYRLTPTLELYSIGQLTLDDDDGAYERNNLVTVGAEYQFGDRSTIGAELSDGSRGHGAAVTAEYRINRDQTVYGGYRYSSDQLTDDLWNDGSATTAQNGWTAGQRWRVTDRLNVYNESQYLKDIDSETSGITNTVGMDYSPGDGWTVGATLMDGNLDSSSGPVDRRAYSLSGGRTDAQTQWSSKLEYRRDSGAEQRTQWVTTNRLLVKLNEDWRLAARANYADTDDDLNPLAGAKLVESNVGFAWRPHDNTRWAAFGKYTYLYDVASLGQDGGDTTDQRSHVLSLEGVMQLGDDWELAAKVAARRGEFRTGRGVGDWLDSRTEFGALQVRYNLIAKWEAMAEYRVLTVRDGGDRKGWLVGLDRQISENFKIGVGYNFTEFSDDLTELEYDQRGWFLNLAGYY